MKAEPFWLERAEVKEKQRRAEHTRDGEPCAEYCFNFH
jgi:hypothetical protein